MSGNKTNDNKLLSFAIKISICSFISSVLFFALIAVFAAAALKSGFSASSYLPAGIVFALLSGFAGGFAVAKIQNEKGAIFGLLNGISQSVICSAILFFINSGNIGKGLLILSAVIICSAVAGGISGVNFKIKKKY